MPKVLKPISITDKGVNAWRRREHLKGMINDLAMQIIVLEGVRSTVQIVQSRKIAGYLKTAKEALQEAVTDLSTNGRFRR